MKLWAHAGLVALAGAFALLAGCSSGSSTLHYLQRGVTGEPGYLVYWDQNEEVDFLSVAGAGHAQVLGQLMPAWDLNGQVCVFPDRSGRFVGGLDPTLPSQHNPGGLKPYKQPAIGEELDLADGAFSGQVLYVPGPYKMPGQTIGEDSPADSHGVFNNNSTYTGCTFVTHGNLLATDIATAQGQYPPPDDGRLVEWFAPKYTSYCIVYGPDAGGVGAHHVDGTGGLSQPGMLTEMTNGNVLMPNAGTDQVLEYDTSSLPTSASQCPGGIYPRSRLKVSVFVQGSSSLLPFPAGVAYDPTCGCYAVSSYFGNPSIVFFSSEGQELSDPAPVPGTPVTQLGQNPNAYNPFGMAFAPDGTMYFVDIHITCSSPLVNCGPASYGGRVMKVTFSNGTPSTPTVVDGGFDFPTSVTVCVPEHQVCPYPSGKIVAPASGPSENDAPAKGPSTDAPAKAGFG